MPALITTTAKWTVTAGQSAALHRAGAMWRRYHVRAQFMTVPEEFPGKARGEKLYPLRTGVVTYIHPQRRYVTVAIMVDGKEIKESFRLEEVLA